MTESPFLLFNLESRTCLLVALALTLRWLHYYHIVKGETEVQRILPSITGTRHILFLSKNKTKQQQQKEIKAFLIALKHGYVKRKQSSSGALTI